LITVHLQPEYVHSQLSELAVGCVPMIADMWINGRPGQKGST